MSTDARYAALLERHRDEFLAELLRSLRRLEWPVERIAAERQRRLRHLLAFARERSPFYRRRVRTVDLESFSEADLPRLPPLSKAEVMEHFDEIVTDSRLSLQVVDEHIDKLRRDCYLLGRFRALPTGGSSGRRGVFVYDWDDWTTFAAMVNRWPMKVALSEASTDPGTVVSIYAERATHISGTLQDFFAPREGEARHRLSVTLPLQTLVAELNRLQPTELNSYPSTVAVLAAEALSGRLDIRPEKISTAGELLSDATRAQAREAWGVEISDVWGCTEGVYAFTCTAAQGMHLPDDLVIVEPVDASGEPVAPGQPASKIYVTNLYNMAQPLIRYEITDSMTVSDEPCPCGSVHRRIFDLQGRLDEIFVYEGGPILRSLMVVFDALEIDRHVVDFQVHQTSRGADVLVVTDGLADLRALETELARAVAGAGLADPVISVVEVEDLPHLVSAKLRHFVPLPGSAERDLST